MAEPTIYDDFKKSFGIHLSDAIDIDTWRIGENLAELYPVIERELLKAKQDEEKNYRIYREQIFPRIGELAHVPHAGLHQDVTSEDIIEKVHRGFLFNGAVTACGSVSAVYETVPISITQIGVALVNYQGQHGSYSHRLYRRDLRFKSDDPIKDAFDLIKRRGGDDLTGDARSNLSTLAVRGIKAFAERAILLEKSDSKWLLGTGSPTPFEIMSGFWASQREMKDRSIRLMRKMILEHTRFVYVQNSTINPQLWTLGNALKPFEYLVRDTMEDNLVRLVERGGTRGEFKTDYEKFAHEVGPKIVYGLYRVSPQSPPQIFYSHSDHIKTAVLIAMADSALQMNLGSPMLLDLANNLCQSAFGNNDFIASVQQAYTKAEVLVKINA